VLSTAGLDASYSMTATVLRARWNGGKAPGVEVDDAGHSDVHAPGW
jgi:hypothetical protein